MRFIDGLRARLRLLFGREEAESRMEEELRFHIDMEAERLAREEGLEPIEARRRALVSFGGQERYREEMRDGRGLAWLSGLWLDIKLGVRMLVKYPIITAASVLALSIAIALATAWFEFTTDMARPSIPFEEADRIVTLRNRDLAIADRDFSSEPRAMYDFALWRDELQSVEHLTALSAGDHTVATEDGRYASLRSVRATPSMFQVTREPPLLGRPLTEADDRPGAPLVVLIGHAVWQRLFDGDRSVIGATVRIGAEHGTVVGVMPEGFGFPLNQELWLPLRERPSSFAPREGPPIRVYGRLAPGKTEEEARAELTTIGRRVAADIPASHEHLQPELGRYGRGGGESAIAAVLNIPFLLFLIVVSANVATLLFARTATRESEIAMRSALGASRRRIVVQLIAEALVVTSLAALLGLGLARWGMGWGMDLFFEVQQMAPPFWFDFGLAATTVVYVGILALLGAVIIGGVPGLRVTRGQLWPRFAQPGAGGSGMRFGRVSTAVIVVQVALCVAFIPVAIMNAQELILDRQASDFPAEAFLSGRVMLDAGPDAPGAAAALFDEAHRRLASEPGVLAATRANRLPGFNHPVQYLQIEGDSSMTLGARVVAVDPDFFDVLGARITEGRSFREADVTSGSDVAIVSREWAGWAFEGRSAIGQRFRYPGESEDGTSGWHEVVGVVEGIEPAIGPGSAVSVFRPLRPEQHASVQFYLRTAGDPESLAPQVASLVTAVSPALGVTDLLPLDDVWRPVERSDLFFTAALGVVSGIILLFALIGIYALMSFAVAQRTREIGIRAALGASPRRIIVTIFSRAVVQIGLGVLLGATLVSLTLARSPEGFRLVGGVAAAMIVIGLIGCLVPAMRALRIQPTEALRAE